MDPTICFREMLTALERGDFVAARERAFNLKAWFERGGFVPAGFDEVDVEAVLKQVLVRTIYPD